MGTLYLVFHIPERSTDILELSVGTLAPSLYHWTLGDGTPLAWQVSKKIRPTWTSIDSGGGAIISGLRTEMRIKVVVHSLFIVAPIIWASSRENLSSGFPTKRDSN